ncbi:MAG: hypothetical protein WBF53_08500, partial [Litorimonas sp.]
MPRPESPVPSLTTDLPVGEALPFADDWGVRLWRSVWTGLLGRTPGPVGPGRPALAQSPRIGRALADIPEAGREGWVGDVARRIWRSVTGSLVSKYTLVISGLIAACVTVLGLFYFMQFRELIDSADRANQAVVSGALLDRDRANAMALGETARALFANVEDDGPELRRRIEDFRLGHGLERVALHGADGAPLSGAD